MLTSGFPGGSGVKASACNAGDLGSIPGLGRSPGERNGTPLQASMLAWRIPWMEEPGGLQAPRVTSPQVTSPQGCKESDTAVRFVSV